MNLFTILIIAFAALVGVVFMAIIASVLAAGIFFVLPQLEQTWVALSLWVLAKHAARVTARALQQTTLSEPPHYAVVICISPLHSPQYLVGLTNRKPVFTPDKADARILRDLLAARSWMFHLEERHGYAPVFVVYPTREVSQ